MTTLREVRARLAALPEGLEDVGLALAVFVTEASFFLLVDPPRASGPWSAGRGAGLALLAARNLPLVWRRRAPLAVLAVLCALLCVNVVIGLRVHDFAFVVALFTVASRVDRRRSALAMAGVAVLVVVLAVATGRTALLPTELATTFAAWVLGDRQQLHRAWIATLEERARLADREREERARRLLAEERARIARELHDVVAHGVSVIVLQTGTARRLLGHAPDRADALLGQAEVSARRSMREMRRLLHVLRPEDAGEAQGTGPGLNDVPTLTDEFRAAGLTVTLQGISGGVGQLPAEVGLAGYRIVQEALTNALKHAEGSHVEVRVAHCPHGVEIEVVNQAPSAPPRPGTAAADGARPPWLSAGAGSGDRVRLGLVGEPDGLGAGQGLRGMRERVEQLGGQLEAGPLPDGGFAVRARIPLRAPARPAPEAESARPAPEAESARPAPEAESATPDRRG